MFHEPYFIGQRSGWIEVICGCMFSGKTEELLRRIERTRYAKQNVLLFKPLTDVRYSHKEVVSHRQHKMEAISIKYASEILEYMDEVEVIGIDEAQFFDNYLIDVVDQLANNGVRVILAGLDKDYKGGPFSPMPAIMAGAEYITKLHAICKHCGNPASFSFRNAEDTEQVMLGKDDLYEARCRKCFQMGLILDFGESDEKPE